MKSSLAVLAVAIALTIPDAIAQPQVAVTRSTAGLTQPLGASRASDSFTLTNFGDVTANVSITQRGNFFTITPSSFTLAATASRSIDVRSATDSAGVFDGSVTVNVAGVTGTVTVPIRLICQQTPSGPVVIQPGTTQVVVSGPPNQTHGQTVVFANSGTGGSSALLGAEAPWLVPQSGAVPIAPKANNTASFVADPSMRPDSAAPLGAAVSNVSLLYLTGQTGNNATAKSTVTVFDITKATPVSQGPTPLNDGDVALFLPGLSDVGFSNVFFSSRTQAGGQPDLRVFYAPQNVAGFIPLLANLGSLAPGVNAWFPDLLSTLYNLRSQTGTLQMRSTRIDRVAASATIGMGVRDDGRDRYITALPLLRSTNSVASGDRLIFSGVEKTTGIHTDLTIIETAGFAASYNAEFFDASGSPLAPSRNGQVQPFTTTTLADTVPAGARSIRLTNTSGTGAARINGVATVVDERTSDAWKIVDSSRIQGSNGQLRVPFPIVSTTFSTQLDLYVTNGTSSPTTVSLGSPTSSRRRAVRNEIGSADDADPQSFVLAPLETRRIAVPQGGQGYVQINGPANAISANARVISTDSTRAGVFGSGLPALPLTTALGPGSVRRFSRQTDDTNFTPTGLILLESSGRPATVKVTLRFAFPAGSTVSGQLTVPKTYQLAANQLLAIPQITRDILGAQRDTIGRIFNLAIDVEVTGADGRVLTYLQTTEASGDITMEVD